MWRGRGEGKSNKQAAQIGITAQGEDQETHLVYTTKALEGILSAIDVKKMLRMSIEITANIRVRKITVITPRETFIILNPNKRQGKRNKVTQKVS